MRFALPLVFSLGLLGCTPPGALYVARLPSAPQAEWVGRAPYPGAVWINGYWGWKGGRPQWHRGYWVQQRRGYVWQPQRWVYRGNGYSFLRGGWQRR